MNDNKKDGKTPKPAQVEEIDILHATNSTLLPDQPHVLPVKTSEAEKPV